MLKPELFVVPDTLRDERFATNPLVTGPSGIRFYAGAPLITSDGYALGALCILDRTPRQLSPEEGDMLQVLARQVVAALELRRSTAGQARMLLERDQVQAELEQERTFLRRIVDTQPSMVFVKDWDGRFVLVNEALARCYGSTVDGVVGKTDADLNPDAGEVSHFVHDDREVMLTRRAKLIPEEPVTNADGTGGLVQHHQGAPGERGRLVRQDPGNRHRHLGAEARAHRVAGDRAAPLDPAAARGARLVWTVGADGRYEYVNRTWEEFTGSSCEELNTGTWRQFHHPDELPEVDRRWAVAIAGGTPFEMELRYRRRDGAYRWMLSRVGPVKDEAGRVSRGWAARWTSTT